MQEAPIEQEKKSEDRRAALICKLTERADAWGRRQLSAVTLATTKAAGQLIGTKVKLLKEADTVYNRLEELGKLAADQLAAKDKIHFEFQPKLDEQEASMAAAKARVTDTVGKFTSDIQNLSMSQLEQVAAGKTVICEVVHGSTGEHAFEFPVVCPDVEGP